MSSTTQPESDRVWSIELNGINPRASSYLLGAAVSIVVFLILRPFFYRQTKTNLIPAEDSTSAVS